MIENLNEILPILLSIVNTSLITGVVPDNFKHALVTPLIKKNNLDPNSMNNYRPVSNLSFLSKILEKVVLKQLSFHLQSNNLVEPFQSAYCSNHSTETALVRVVSDLLVAADNGNVSILSLLDLSAAFDTLDHNILLNRLRNTFGLSNTVLSWFESYLTGRSQCVLVNNSKSNVKHLQNGVPQGSVLGPVLFVMYTKPLSNVISNHLVSYHLYADDTQLYLGSDTTSFNICKETVEFCISNVYKWMCRNKLKMNESKTEIMTIGSVSKLNSIDCSSVNICGHEITVSAKARNLGVIFDSQLSMEHQINSVCKAIFLELRRISLIRKYISPEAANQLVSSFILSRIDYCNSLYAGLSLTKVNKLQRAQNNAARLVLRKSKVNHIKPLLEQLHWLPVEKRIVYKIATLTYRSLYCDMPNYMQDLLIPYAPSRMLRSSVTNLLKTPRITYRSFGERSFFYQAPSIWNSLPPEVRETKSYESFKTKLKTYLFSL